MNHPLNLGNVDVQFEIRKAAAYDGLGLIVMNGEAASTLTPVGPGANGSGAVTVRPAAAQGVTDKAFSNVAIKAAITKSPSVADNELVSHGSGVTGVTVGKVLRVKGDCAREAWHPLFGQRIRYGAASAEVAFVSVSSG